MRSRAQNRSAQHGRKLSQARLSVAPKGLVRRPDDSRSSADASGLSSGLFAAWSNSAGAIRAVRRYRPIPGIAYYIFLFIWGIPLVVPFLIDRLLTQRLASLEATVVFPSAWFARFTRAVETGLRWPAWRH